MTLSSRSRREWRIILWLSVGSAVISAGFGVLVRSDDPLVAIAAGITNSLLIATPILLLEIKGQRGALLRRLRRLPLPLYFGLKVLFYIVVIVVALVSVNRLYGVSRGILDEIFGVSILFAIGMSLLANLVFTMGGLLGFATLRNLMTGRYVQPRRERKAFMLIDMKNSTGLAERLGPIRFHELLNVFFSNIADAALECDAEIHKYVGDEAILTWPDVSPSSNACLACPFVARDFIDAARSTYSERFGVVPEFRAALHYGEIVAGEIGDVRREIAYVGDTLNVAARLLEAAKTLGHDVLVSTELLERVALPAGVRAEPLPTLAVRGRAAPLGIAALERVGEQQPVPQSA